MGMASRSILMVCLISLALTCCRRKFDNSTGSGQGIYHPGGQNLGTEHGGGGTSTKSTPEQVNEAIDMAIQMTLEPEWIKNIFAQFVNDKHFSKNQAERDFFKYPKYIYPIDPSGNSSEKVFDSPQFKAFGTNTIERIPQGDCPHRPDEETADASVSSFDLTAKICFSVGNLAKLAPSILLKEVLGLIIHEAAHMGEADEKEARKYQKYFTDYFAARFGDVTVDDFTRTTQGILNVTNRKILRAKNTASSQLVNSRHSFAQMGSIIADMNSIPYMDDPLAIELKARPKHPEMIENFWVLLNTIAQFSSQAFEPPNELMQATLVPYMGRIVEDDKILEKITEIESKWTCLIETYQAFDTGILRKECLQPKLKPLQKFLLLPRKISFDNGTEI